MLALQAYMWMARPDLTVGSPLPAMVFRPSNQSTLASLPSSAFSAGKGMGIHRSWLGSAMASLKCGAMPPCSTGTRRPCITDGRTRYSHLQSIKESAASTRECGLINQFIPSTCYVQNNRRPVIISAVQRHNPNDSPHSRALVLRPGNGERRTAKLLGVQAVRALLWRVLPHGKGSRKGLARVLRAEATEVLQHAPRHDVVVLVVLDGRRLRRVRHFRFNSKKLKNADGA